MVPQGFRLRFARFGRRGGAGRYAVRSTGFALIRHWRATFPLEGEGFSAVRGFMWYLLAKEIPHHPGSRTERSEGEDFEAPPQIPLSTSFRKRLQEFQSFTAKGTRKRSTFRHVPPFRVPFAVKFWEFLEPSPKEGSKQGLGRRPKVLKK